MFHPDMSVKEIFAIWYKISLFKCTRWCKREHVESNALNNWKLKIFKIIDERVLFYSNNLDLLPLSLNCLFDI